MRFPAAVSFKFTARMPSVWNRVYQLSCNSNAIFSKKLAQPPQIPVDGTIRRMLPEHNKLLRLFWGTHYCDNDWLFTPPAITVDIWLTDNNVRIWGYSHNDMLLATLMFRRLAEKPWSIMSVDCICVHRDVRGKALTAMLLENVIYQGANMRWLEEGKPFSILGFRESATTSMLHDLVPPFKKEKYIWSEGKSPAIEKGQQTLHFNIGGTKIILFNTWRQTFPGGKEQWEICWISQQKGNLTALREVCPSNIQIWVSSLYIDFMLEPEKDRIGWSTAEGWLLLECWGTPPSMSMLPYTHF